ncbi:MAG: DNA polymerase [Hyphomicrobiaceae bacterium]
MDPIDSAFASVWIVVFAATAKSGEVVAPLALSARDAKTGLQIAIGAPKLFGVRRPPYPTGPRTLLVTIDADMVVGCHLALGWRVPERLVDLMIECRNDMGGQSAELVGGLGGALLRYGLPTAGALISGTSPEKMRRRLAVVSGLFMAMAPRLDLGRALLRGRYMCAVARIEAAGVPVDTTTLGRLTADWPAIRSSVIEIVDEAYGVHHRGRLDEGALAAWLGGRAIDWPRLPSGRLDLGDDTFRDMARAHPELRPLRELRATGSGFDPSAIAVGRDGRNRTPLRPFASRPGRSQPSAKASVLGKAAWIRHLILPAAGTGLALIDWTQQEFGIAAALSGDTAMQAAYASGDPYLALAIRAGAAPPDATPASHADARARFKICALGLQYGMGVATLGRLIGQSEAAARELQRSHRGAFPKFWTWSDQVEAHAMLTGRVSSVFGWTMHVGAGANPRAIRNFPLQANGAEMLRLACCLATEAGIKVCAPIHDALLIEAPLRDLDDAIATAEHLMAEASAVVLDGFALRSSTRRVRAPERWREAKGRVVWEAVCRALGERPAPVRGCHAT